MRTLSCLLLLLSLPAFAAAPVDPFLRQYAETRRFTSGRPVQPTVTPDDKTVLFLRAAPTSNRQTLFAFDVASGATTELLTPETLLHGAEETLSAEEKARRERKRVTSRGFAGFQLSDDGARILLQLSGKSYVFTRATAHVQELPQSAGAQDPQFSPDGKRVAYVRANDVFQVDLATGREQRVTTGGTAQKPHGVAEFVAQEEMGRMSGYWWSADSQSIAFAEVDNAPVEQLTLGDVLHPERAGEPVAYPRAGKANANVRLGVVAASGGKVTWLKWDAKALPYVATVTWQRNAPLTLVVQNRAQTAEQVLAVDAKTGATRVLLTETDPAWVDIEQDFPLWLEDGRGFLWRTEQHDGPEIVEHRADGTPVRTWLKPDTGFRKLAGFVQKTRTLYWNGDRDPTQTHAWRVTDGGAPERVAVAAHAPVESALMVAKSGALLVAASQTDKTLPQTWLLRQNGEVAAELASLVAPPPFVPNLQFLTVGADNVHAVVYRPHGAKPGMKLPTILSVYGGPTATVVRHGLRENLLDQWLADQGFIVVRADGRGTPLRTAQWQRLIKGDFATVPLDDQVTALREVAKQVPEIDLARVGIYGWSFGGYLSALAALKRPDVFKAAVAGAPVVDWADYDTHYTERYLGLSPEAYRVSSLLTYASDPELPSAALLLIHGTADDNVYFFHTLKLANALFLAGKAYDLLPLAGLTHLVPDPVVMQRENERILSFFRARL